jgi:hypothetical protein
VASGGCDASLSAAIIARRGQGAVAARMGRIGVTGREMVGWGLLAGAEASAAALKAVHFDRGERITCERCGHVGPPTRTKR